MTTFADHYGNLVAKILSEEAERDFNQRTQTNIAFLPEGYSFAIDLSDNILPTCGLRRTRPHIAAAEAAWCFLGTTNLTWLQKHTRIWDQFASWDGSIMEAYGYRWRFAFQFDQLQSAVQRLTVDPSDRRVWITSYDPKFDLRNHDQKTVPCPVGFTLSVFKNLLNSTYVIRSSDVFIGLPLDIMRHALVMNAMANSMNYDLGYMRVTLAHPHLYESQWDMAREMLEQEPKVPNIQMPTDMWTVNYVTFHPDEYVAFVRDAVFASTPWPDYDPRVEVVK